MRDCTEPEMERIDVANRHGMQLAMSVKKGGNAPLSNQRRLDRALQQVAQRAAVRSGDRPRRALLRRGELPAWLRLVQQQREDVAS